MDMTSRQLGRVEACCFALEEATEKNLVAARLVKVIRETLDEITQTAFPGELDHDWDMEFHHYLFSQLHLQVSIAHCTYCENQLACLVIF